MQITVEPGKLNKEQRELLAGFILAFPNSDGTGNYYAGDDLPEDAGAMPKASIEAENDPAAAFGQHQMSLQAIDPAGNITAHVSTGTISPLGPVLVVPNPEPTPVPAAVPINSAVTLDKAGYPWDARIHASSKSFNGDGTWRAKRGVNKDTVVQVEAELRRLMAIPTPLPMSAPPPPPPATPNPELQSAFISLVGRTSAAIAAGKLTQDQLQKCCDTVGITDLPKLGIRLDLVPAFAAMVNGIIAGQTA